MPMSIRDYSLLISHLPVREQCFETKRSTWRKAEGKYEWLLEFNDVLFRDDESVEISREDIFRTSSLRDVILKAIYWGYPRGMRGNHFTNLITQMESLETIIAPLVGKDRLSAEDFNRLRNQFKNIEGLGLSTYSKLLYFLRIKFNSHECLILDQRLIDVFNSRTFPEFENLSGIRYDNARDKYLEYLNVMSDLSHQIGTNGENLEQFLFIFGRNLKSVALNG
jgi:hypothetical protein